MIVKLLTEHHLEFQNLKEAADACLKMPHFWKSHVTAHILFMLRYYNNSFLLL